MRPVRGGTGRPAVDEPGRTRDDGDRHQPGGRGSHRRHARRRHGPATRDAPVHGGAARVRLQRGAPSRWRRRGRRQRCPVGRGVHHGPRHLLRGGRVRSREPQGPAAPRARARPRHPADRDLALRDTDRAAPDAGSGRLRPPQRGRRRPSRRDGSRAPGPPPDPGLLAQEHGVRRAPHSTRHQDHRGSGPPAAGDGARIRGSISSRQHHPACRDQANWVREEVRSSRR